MTTIVDFVVEGESDAAVAARLLGWIGARPGRPFILGGKRCVLQRLPAYNQAASFSPWFVLVDLDRDAECAPSLRSRLLPEPAPRMCFRIAVRALEAWLLADCENLAAFLRISPKVVPTDPERLPDPKRTLVDLARRSRKRAIREDLVPRARARTRVGPAYGSRLREFVDHHWDPGAARKHAPSLDRAIQCLGRLVEVGDTC